MKTKLAHQADMEYRAGYQIGLAGGPEPKQGEGASRWKGWSDGRADRVEIGPGWLKEGK